ncbi:major facilitator superfamily domain-containing protein [Phyllosticta citrichinensis]|uniref:Major facilitator superfamily domain-containing protein n=1 Tax=Phyllosticta citrichinensis TaxID=1130410 RepID=A0ABR1XQI4_9PEZI
MCVESNETLSDAAEETKLVRKIDLYLLPPIWLTYCLAYMDRINIGNAKIAGMKDDLNLTSNQYSICLVVFFVSYVVFEIPCNLILSHTRPSIFLPTIMFAWGAITCCMAAVHTFSHLVALRFLLGIAEAGFAPGVLLLLSSWYKKNEQSKRFGVYISAAVLSGAFGGILAGAITASLHKAHGITGWRWLFIVEGAATCGVAIIFRFILLDFPATTNKLSSAERELALSRLEDDKVNSMRQDSTRLSPLQAISLALQNWKTWLLAVGYMVIVGSSTLSYFYPTLVKQLGYTSCSTAQYMVVPIYCASFVTLLITSVLCDRRPAYRAPAISLLLLLSTTCAVAASATAASTARYILLIFLACGLWAANGLALAFAASSFSALPQDVRGVSLAFVNSSGNLAQIYGAYLFPEEDAPRYLKGFLVVSALCGLGIFVYAVAGVALRRPLTLDNEACSQHRRRTEVWQVMNKWKSWHP